MDDSLKLINDAQRSALAQIVVRRFNHRIDIAQSTIDEITLQIEKAIAKPFDADKLDAEIKRFRTLVDNLEVRKRELSLVQTLRSERDTVEQGIWLAATVEEAQRLVTLAEGAKEATS